MSTLVGFTSIALVSIMTILCGKKWPSISKILFAALLIRIFVLLLGHYVLILPIVQLTPNHLKLLLGI